MTYTISEWELNFSLRPLRLKKREFNRKDAKKRKVRKAQFSCRYRYKENIMYRIALALLALSLQGVLAQEVAVQSYKGPMWLCAAKDGQTIYVVHKDSHEIAVLNTVEDKIVKTISLGSGIFPQGAVLGADEKTLYVTGGGHKGRVFAVDTATGNVTKTVPAGHTPTAAVMTPDGTKLYVCNQFTNDVSEYRLPDLTLTRTINAVREPRAAVVTQDGKYVLVANMLPLEPANFLNENIQSTNVYVASKITYIDVATGEARSPRNLPNGCGVLSGMCLSPDGRYVYVTTIVGRTETRTNHVKGGWINAAGIVVLDTTLLEDETGGLINAALIDHHGLGAAYPWGITTSADGTKLYVAIAGTSELMMIDAVEMVKRMKNEPRHVIPNEYISPYSGGNELYKEMHRNTMFLGGLKKRVTLPGKGARALTVAGNNIYVGMYFSDTVQKVDETLSSPVEIALGPVPVWTPERRGEVWWNDATLCDEHWQSCASCHPDARMEGHNWDLLNDGEGNLKNTKSLLFSHETTPSMWQGVRDNPELDGWDTKTMGLQCIRTGFEFIQFVQPDEEKSKDIDAYLRALQPVPSPYLAEGQLSEKAQRGKIIFEDRQVGCTKCHPAPFFTDNKPHDVNSRSYYDTVSSFYTPPLIEVWRTAPYLHDGRYVDMKEVFTHGKHGDVAGDVAGLTEEQIDDLVEYILSL